MKRRNSAPEVFIEESTSLQQTIRPASTATTAIIGSFPKGKMGTARLIKTWGEFEKFYGSLTRNTLSSHCVKQFFDNEGRALWVIRIGTRQLKSADPFLRGLSLLDRINHFNTLCIPQTEQLPDSEAAKVIQAAITLAAQHHAMYLLDIPRQDAPRYTITTLTSWLNRQSGLRHPNVALYIPRVHVLQTSKLSPLHAIPASGTMAGVFARTDHHRGVWESPAGTEAILQGVRGLEQTLTQFEMGQLNGMGINPIRQISPSQSVAWGARTLSSDPEWTYVSVRRTALFIESSIRKGLAWAASEPNDEPLWAQIRQSLEAFMQTLFHKGAFQGQKPQEAYFVKCGRETISAADQRAGVIHITIGFAPLKPAEFIILKLQQQAKTSSSA